jgi:flagellar hook-associated protein 1 FlgK
MGLNSALAAASQSLQVFSTGVQVAGQNIANASTPGYVREALLLDPAPPYQQGSLVFGTGVQATGIQQQINKYLETRIHSANSDAESAAAVAYIYKQLEVQLQELGSSDLSTNVNNLLAAINEVVNQPESSSLRQLAVQQGGQLASDIRSLRDRVNALRESQSAQVDSLVSEANRLLDTIEQLNPQISKLESGGLLQSDAGALRSQRYEALNRLSEILPIKYTERADGSVDVFTGSDYLILGGSSQRLETVTTGDRDISINTVRLSKTKSNVDSGGGELGGVIKGRDDVLGGFIDQLNTLAENLIFEFNKIHSSGEGLRGYDSLTSQSKVSDVNLALNAAGLEFQPVHGSFDLKVTDKSTGITTTTNIAIDLDGIGSNDTTLASLQAALDAVGNVSATMTTDRRLTITADNNFDIRFGNDTSGALAALGINTFFTGSDSNDIGVNSTIAADPQLFATSQGGGPSDGRNAIALATFFDNAVAALGNVSLDAFYNNTVSSIAQSSASASVLANGFSSFRDGMLNQRDQFSGVSLDEEAVLILQFQQAFQSAARIISTIDELFTTLLQM